MTLPGLGLLGLALHDAAHRAHTIGGGWRIQRHYPNNRQTLQHVGERRTGKGAVPIWRLQGRKDDRPAVRRNLPKAGVPGSVRRAKARRGVLHGEAV